MRCKAGARYAAPRAGGLAAQGLPRLGGQVSFAENANAGLGLRLEAPLGLTRRQDIRLDAGFDCDAAT